MQSALNIRYLFQCNFYQYLQMRPLPNKKNARHIAQSTSV